jgi:hypothetical protein
MKGSFFGRTSNLSTPVLLFTAAALIFIISIAFMQQANNPVTMTTTSTATSTSSQHGSRLARLWVEGNQIRDQHGPLFLFGACYNGQFRAFPGTDFWTYAPQAAKLIKSYGFNCVRLVGCYWALVETSRNPGEFKYDMSYVQHIKDTVNAFAAEGIYVVLDMHKTPMASDINSLAHFVPWSGQGDDFADAFFTDTSAASAREHLKALWLMMSNIFKDNWNVAGYDLLNEPHHAGQVDSQTISNLWWDIEDYLTSALRANGDNHIIFCEISPWEHWDFMQRKLKDPNTVYEPHFYGGAATPVTDINAIRTLFAPTRNKMTVFDVPFIVGEMAAYNGADIAPGSARDIYLVNLLQVFKEAPTMRGYWYWQFEAYTPQQTGAGSGWQQRLAEAAADKPTQVHTQ